MDLESVKLPWSIAPSVDGSMRVEGKFGVFARFYGPSAKELTELFCEALKKKLSTMEDTADGIPGTIAI